MTAAQCLERILLCEKPEFIPNYENVALYPRLEAQWHSQGLPADQTINEFFGFVEPIHWYGWVGRGKYEPLPGAPGQGVIAEDAQSTTYRDCWGRETRWFKGEDMPEGAHEILKDGIPDRAAWEGIRNHFLPDEPWRYPGGVDPSRQACCFPAHCWPPASYRGEQTTLADLRQMAAGGEVLLQIAGPSMFGELKEYMGYEHLCDAMYSDRSLVREIIQTRTELALHVIARMMDAVPFSILHFWEDIACNTGPLIAPDVFEELAVPAYRQIAELFRSKGGRIVSVDSDGDIRLLIPGWVQGGITHLWPMEVKAGMDVVALRKQYGKAFSMRGGIDKYILFGNRDAMRRELERIAPVVEDGGYMPMIDHSVPLGVTFNSFCTYMELKQEILGIRCAPRVSRTREELAGQS